MATEEGTEPTSPIDEVMEDIRRELVQRVAAADRDANRDVYDALEDEQLAGFFPPRIDFPPARPV